MDQSTIAEGIGGVTFGADADGAPGWINVRQKHIQGWVANNATSTPITDGSAWESVPNTVNPTGVAIAVVTRRYQIQLGTGLFTQEKLIPTKFMASQLAIEMTLEQAQSCIYVQANSAGTNTFAPTYWVTEVNLIPEVLEFDGSYGTKLINVRRYVPPRSYSGRCTNQV